MDEAVPALAVVDARFCAGDEAALAVAKTLSMSGNDFTVTDAATGDVLLRVGGVLFSLRRRCLLADAHRRPVLTVQESVRIPSRFHPFFLPDSVSPTKTKLVRFLLLCAAPLGGIRELTTTTSDRWSGTVGAGAGDEQALEGVPRGQHQPPGPALHGRQAVGHPAALVHQGQRLPRQQRRRAGLRLQDHRKLPRRRLLRIPRRLRHRHRKDRPAVHRGELAAGEEHLQRHRQPGHRLRLRRRARRRPGRDALPMISATAASGRLNESLCIRPSHVVLFLSSACVCGHG